MFTKIWNFVAQFLQENNNRSSSKRLAMLTPILAGIVLVFFSFFKNQEIPNSALTLITTLISVGTANYTITRWKEDPKKKDVEI